MANPAPTPSVATTTIEGVEVLGLNMHVDERGSLTELYRREWVDRDFIQWNVVKSQGNVLRGVHLHTTHHDYITVIDGEAYFALRDLRRGSPTESKTFSVTISGETPRVLRIPPGVAHGFCFEQPATIVYSVTHTWDHADELGCRYDDRALGLNWPVKNPSLSPRDQNAPSFQALLGQLRAGAAAPLTTVSSPAA